MYKTVWPDCWLSKFLDHRDFLIEDKVEKYISSKL
jgi:hypothetical protein